MDISSRRPCQPEKLIPLLPWPGFDPSFSGHNDRRAIISEWNDYASDRSAIGAGSIKQVNFFFIFHNNKGNRKTTQTCLCRRFSAKLSKTMCLLKTDVLLSECPHNTCTSILIKIKNPWFFWFFCSDLNHDLNQWFKSNDLNQMI